MTSPRPADWPAPGRKIDLDTDDLPHASAGLEWWYLNAHMTDEQGRQYAAYAAFFRMARRDPAAGDSVRHAHTFLWGLWESDEQRYRTASAVDATAVEFHRRQLTADTFVEPSLRRAQLEALKTGHPIAPDVLMRSVVVGEAELRLLHDRAELARCDGEYVLHARHPDFGLDLRFQPGCEPVRYGADGIVAGRQGDAKGQMFYYTVPCGAISGTVVVDGERRQLSSGTGWYDHEFGMGISRLGETPDRDEPRTDTTWEWAGLHLDDGTAVTFQIVHDVDLGTDRDTVRHAVAVAVGPAGTSRSAAEVRIEVIETWTSLVTFATYPVRMRVMIPALEVDLILSAVLENQECVTGSVCFWEGRVTVSGTSNGMAVTGVGFVEVLPRHLYDTMEGFLRRPSDEVRRKIRVMYPDDVDIQAAAEIAGASDLALVGGVNRLDLTASIVRPTRYLADVGGKAWRPYLGILALQLCGANVDGNAEMMHAAEMLHLGALIVDDVEDQSAVRRGVPTVHKVFGEPLAINAGTALYFSFDRIARMLREQDPAVQLELYRTFCETLRLAHTGQALDLLGHRDALHAAIESGDPSHLEEQILAVHRLKTGVAVRALAETAAILGRAGPQLRAALRDYFCALGLAYQISDDVWDLAEERPRPGAIQKPRLRPLGEDIRTGKIGLPLAKAVGLLPRGRMQQLWRTIDAKPRDARTVRACIDTIAGCGAIDLCIRQMEDLIERAWQPLAPLVAGTRGGTGARALGFYAVYRDNWPPDEPGSPGSSCR